MKMYLKLWDRFHSDSASSSPGAHNTHRPLALPLTASSRMRGCEAVTACTAVILQNESDTMKGRDWGCPTLMDLKVERSSHPVAEV